MKIVDLRNKTVLDFTRDRQLISKILAIPSGMDYNEYIEFYLETCHPANHAAAIAEFAKIIGDDKLERQAQTLYTQLMDESTNEAREIYTTTGILVD